MPQKLKQVDPKTIKIPEVRVTARFDEETREMFKRSIKETGQVAPIICVEMDGELVLVDGLHRLQEAMSNGAKSIATVVTPGDMVDVLTKNIFVDHLRGKTPPSEMVKVIEALWQEYSLDSDQIAARTGLTRDYVEKLQLISQLTPMCREALDQGLIGVGHAASLTRLNDPIKQETVLNQQLLYRWSVKVLNEYIKDVLAIVEAPPTEPAPPGEQHPDTIRCTFCGEDYEIKRIKNPNTCDVCSGILFQSISIAAQQAREEQQQQEDSAKTVTE